MMKVGQNSHNFSINELVEKLEKKETVVQSSNNTVISDVETAVETDEKKYIIRCPYCQKTIDLREAHFRAVNAYSIEQIMKMKDDLKKEQDSARSGVGDSEKIRAKINELEHKLNEMENYIAVPDDILINFWKDKGWTDKDKNLIEFPWGYGEASKNGVNGITEGTSVFEVKSYILKNEQMSIEKTNKDGIILSVRDDRDIISDIRICDKCHCILPRNYTGQNTYFISVVGIKGSGKTVFISKLLEEMNKEENETTRVKLGLRGDFETDTMDFFVKQKRIAKGQPLPDSTSMSFKPPVFINISNDKGFYTLVLYDIAGEICINKEKIVKVGDFIKNSDIILLLISPEQLKKVTLSKKDYRENSMGGLTDVVKTISTTYFDEAYRENGEICDAKFAVVLSQSDVYKEATIKGNRLSVHNLYEDIDYSLGNGGYMIDQHKNMSGDVINILKRTSLINTLNDHFKSVEYFAVSVLGSRPIMRLKDTEKIVIRDNEGNLIFAENNEKITHENVAIEYIAPDTEPIRLEEPLAWALYKLGIIDGFPDEEKKKISFLNIFRGK